MSLEADSEIAPASFQRTWTVRLPVFLRSCRKLAESEFQIPSAVTVGRIDGKGSAEMRYGLFQVRRSCQGHSEMFVGLAVPWVQLQSLSSLFCTTPHIGPQKGKTIVGTPDLQYLDR
jgi:small ligand-binding sensory domain FIST